MTSDPLTYQVRSHRWAPTLVKVDGVPRVRNVTQLELTHLERNPAFFRDLAVALHELQPVNQASAEHPNGPSVIAQQVQGGAPGCE